MERRSLFSGDLLGHLINGVIIIACSFLVPIYIFGHQIGFEDVKAKRETLEKFSKNITEAIYFQTAMQRRDCELSDPKLKGKWKEIELARDEFYKRIIAIPYTYEALCELVKIDFGDKIKQDVEKFKIQFEEFMSVDCFQKSSNGACSRQKKSLEIQEGLLETYEEIIRMMSIILREAKED